MTLPRRRNQTPGVLVLALLAGLLAMHGLSGTALADPMPQVVPVAVMGVDMASRPVVDGALPAAPAPDSPHHGGAANGHHPCLAIPAAVVGLAAAADTAAPALGLPHQALVSAPTRARADRAPPDLNDLCVSRT